MRLGGVGPGPWCVRRGKTGQGVKVQGRREQGKELQRPIAIAEDVEGTEAVSN